MVHDLTLLFATGLYLTAWGLLYGSIALRRERWRTLAVAMSSAGALAHILAQQQHWLSSGMPDVGFLNLLSLCALVIVIMLCLSVLSQEPLFDAGLVALPLTSVVLLIEYLVPSTPLLVEIDAPGTAVHIISSVLAFGLLSIAGVYAVFVVLIDHFLRRHHLNPLVRALPPLEILERLLFRLIGGGFGLLTISLASGLAFVSDLFAQHLAHKTILSFLAWVVFGALLLGRRLAGWRGRRAVWFSLAGIALLMLAYFGSKLVLELILDRNWWS